MRANDFRRGECRGEKQTASAKARSLQNARAISTASFVGRFHFIPLEAALCSDPNPQDQNIRPAGPPWREYALPGAEMNYENETLRVRQHAPDFLRVRRIDLDRPAKMAHAFRLFGAEQMALERVRPHDFAGLRYAEALGGATMCF
jgi:hypothetical protein